jgi:hypothetical protein
VSTAHIADTGFIAALGGPENERYRRVRTFARQKGVVFVLPERVYGELTASETEDPHVDTAITDGWVRVAPSLNYTDSLVSRTMDSVQRYIANADDRRADNVERADAALGGVAAQLLIAESPSSAFVYTTDIAAGEAVETALSDAGYADAVAFVNAFEFIEDLAK